MDRRTFTTGVVSAAVAAAGCLGGGEDGSSFPSYDTPVYSDWIGTNDGSDGVFFTHVDWTASETEPEGDESGTDGDDETDEIVEEVPILGLPLYGAVTSSFALFAIMFYPFAEDVLPEEGVDVEGIETESMTWAGDVLVFHGTYDPEAFEDRYAEGFERADDRNGYALFVGTDDSTEGSAYAVSGDTLLVGMVPGSDDDYVLEEVVTDAIDRTVEETGRVTDTEDGRWLFETTGEGLMAFGAWEADDFTGALEGGSADGQSGEEIDPEVEDNPVFDNVTSLANTIAEVENGETIDMEARFSAVYPEDGVPSEDELVEHLVGEEDVPHEITIEDDRVNVVATFEEDAIEES